MRGLANVYALVGMILVAGVAYANFTGWTFIDAMKTGKWGPHGKAARMRHK